MKNRRLFIQVLSLVSLFALTSCESNTPVSSNSGELPEIVGGEDWDKPWEDPWNGENDEPAHVCSEKCYSCGKCLNESCQEEACKQKCSELGDRKAQTFYAISDNVSRTNGSRGPFSINQDSDGGYLGEFNLNKGASFTYVMESSKAEKNACLQVVVSAPPIDIVLSSALGVNINGKDLISRVKARSANGPVWTTFETITFGCIDLLEGKNVFTFESNSDSVTSFNFKAIRVLAKVTLTEKDALEGTRHTCSSQKDGKCTDYSCNRKECLDKDETGWKNMSINGADNEVIKETADGGNLWIPEESCIGRINDALGQIIIWAFESEEDSIARFSLEHSANGDSLFTDYWEMKLNGEEMITEGYTQNVSPDWFTFVTSKVGYFPIKKGKNQFMMIHNKIKPGYNLRSLTISYQKGNVIEAQASK